MKLMQHIDESLLKLQDETCTRATQRAEGGTRDNFGRQNSSSHTAKFGIKRSAKKVRREPDNLGKEARNVANQRTTTRGKELRTNSRSENVCRGGSDKQLEHPQVHPNTKVTQPVNKSSELGDETNVIILKETSRHKLLKVITPRDSNKDVREVISKRFNVPASKVQVIPLTSPFTSKDRNTDGPSKKQSDISGNAIECQQQQLKAVAVSDIATRLTEIAISRLMKWHRKAA